MLKKRLLHVMIIGLSGLIVCLTTACQNAAPPPTTAVTNPTEASTAVPSQNQVMEIARQDLAGQLNLPPESIEVMTIQEVNWPDACLGVYPANEVCAKTAVSGYLFIFQANNKLFTYHTNYDGRQLVFVPTAVPPEGGLAATWRQGDQCTTAVMRGNTGLQVGPCDGELTAVQFSPTTPNAATDLITTALSNMPFYADTPDGAVVLNGLGTHIPTPVEQRQIMNLARWLADAATDTQSPDTQPVLVYHQNHTENGVCTDLSVYNTGRMTLTSCADTPAPDYGDYWLTSDQLGQLYTWVDSLTTISLTPDSTTTPTAAGSQLLFTGSGSSAASPADEQAILTLANELVDTIQGGQSSPTVPLP